MLASLAIWASRFFKRVLGGRCEQKHAQPASSEAKVRRGRRARWTARGPVGKYRVPTADALADAAYSHSSTTLSLVPRPAEYMTEIN